MIIERSSELFIERFGLQVLLRLHLHYTKLNYTLNRNDDVMMIVVDV